ncbi:hypothetical protein GCM10010347_58060 [Streptomyces cirratus]|uniref:Uncharacterized protein n=1 Tax=Streptomyces cirratus TaxID=68187 RepID=A0ABQ3F0P5_9ACTN|nr:hypothetical protein GCM10010347_58060 [Streptomyces cirratus]
MNSTTTRYGDPIYHPPRSSSPHCRLRELPPGVETVTLPNGYRTLAYTQPARDPLRGRPGTWPRTRV